MHADLNSPTRGVELTGSAKQIAKVEHLINDVLNESIGFIGPGVALLCLNFAKTPVVASIFITFALSLSSFSQAGFLLNMQDIAPQYAGFLHGISNSAGTLAAIISTIGTGYFVQWLGSVQWLGTGYFVQLEQGLLWCFEIHHGEWRKGL